MGVRRNLQLLAGACLMAAATGCGSSSQKTVSHPFAYDKAQRFKFADRGRVNKDYPIAIHDVSYQAGRDRISAFLALPPENGKKRPAIIYLHGSGGDRRTLIVPATWAAGRGAVGLTITAPSVSASTAAAGSPVAELRRDVRLEESDVIAVRRAIDLLRHRSDVDPNRIGFVGWSAGARTGAILAGVEPRLNTLVLMSGAAVPVQVYSNSAPKKLRKTLARYLKIVDPLRYVRRAKASGLFLQDGRQDDVVPRSALVALVSAAPTGTTVHWYGAGHALDSKAYREQLAWLTRKLSIGPAVKGALTGPS